MLVVGRWSHIRRRLLCQWSDFGRLRLGPAGVGPAALAGCPTCRAGDWGRPQPRQLESDLLAGAVPVAALRGACQCQWTCTWASHEGVHWQVRPTATLRRADRHGDVLSSHCKHAPALAWPPSPQRAEVRNVPKSARPHLTRVAARSLAATRRHHAWRGTGAVVYSASKSTRLSLRPRWRFHSERQGALTSPLQPRTVSELQLALAALTSVPIRHRTRLAQPPALEAPSI